MSGIYFNDTSFTGDHSFPPVVNLGPDTGFCAGGSITLNAGFSPCFAYTYKWNTLRHPGTIATTQTINVDSAATYIATVGNGYGVYTSDTVVISKFAVPVDSIILYDTSCAQLTLNAGSGFSSYTWSTGATTSAINVTSTGTYWVDVMNTHGCVTRDSAHVKIYALATANTSPQSVCYLDTLQIVNASAANYDSLIWATNGDGHFIGDSTLLLPMYKLGTNDTTNGTVKLILTAYSKCNTVSDTMVISVTKTPTASAGSDQSVCPGMCAALMASGGYSYVWSPSIGLSNTNISNPLACPSAYSTYTVTATSSCGTASADVTVSIYSSPTINVTPSNPTICMGNSVTLTANGANTYLWTGGITADPIVVSPTSATTYSVTGTDNNGCTATTSETVSVDYITVPHLGVDTTLCAGLSINVDAGSGYNSYLW
jgi:hypothetical protein